MRDLLNYNYNGGEIFDWCWVPIKDDVEIRVNLILNNEIEEIKECELTLLSGACGTIELK